MTPEHQAVWDAINRYAETCGGDTSVETVSTDRQRAVVGVEQAIITYVGQRMSDLARSFGESLVERVVDQAADLEATRISLWLSERLNGLESTEESAIVARELEQIMDGIAAGQYIPCGCENEPRAEPDTSDQTVN